jgi:hypothetical protein
MARAEKEYARGFALMMDGKLAQSLEVFNKVGGAAVVFWGAGAARERGVGWWRWGAGARREECTESRWHHSSRH